jgi:predicted neuraminidase
LNLAFSRDGKNWDAAMVLEYEPPGQYSYPCIIQSRDGLVHVAYTWKRLKMGYRCIDPSKLPSRPMKGGLWPSEIAYY